jgi:hypothetical protein
MVMALKKNMISEDPRQQCMYSILQWLSSIAGFIRQIALAAGSTPGRVAM